MVYMSTVLFPSLFKRSIQYSCLLLVFYFLVCLFVSLFQYIIVEGWRAKPSVSFRVSRIFKQHLYTTHINTCHVLLLLLQYPWIPRHPLLPNISTYHILLTVPCRVSYCLLQGLGNSCTGELQKLNSRCFGRGLATASFGLGPSCPGVRIP